MTVLMKMIDNQDLCKLLYYNSKTPLSEPDIEDTTSLLFSYIYPTPFSGVTDSSKSFITVIFDDFTLGKNNPEFKNSKIIIDVICHIDLWQISGGLRPYSIMGKVDKMFNDQRVIGIGKLTIDSARWIAMNEKFQGYRMIFKVCDFNV